MSIRTIIVIIIALLPASRVKNAMLCRLGWAIGREVRIGPCLVSRLSQARIGDHVAIGAFNVFRDLARLELADYVLIGRWNWITASYHMRQAGGPATLEVGEHSAITSRHYLDCTGGVRIGSCTTIAGERSTFLTHGISWVSSEQTYGPIEIGDFCLFSSNMHVTPGTTVGDRVVVGMGSTISGELAEPGLYMQPRAVLVKPDLAGRYFQRKQGHVHSVRPRK